MEKLMNKQETAFQMTRDIIDEYHLYRTDTDGVDYTKHADEYFGYLFDNFPMDADKDLEADSDGLKSMMRNGNSITTGEFIVNENMPNSVFVLSLLRYVFCNSSTPIRRDVQPNWTKLFNRIHIFVMESVRN